MQRYSLSVDIGGTFTDIVLLDQLSGSHYLNKTLTTHHDPKQGVLSGISQLFAQNNIEPQAVGRLIHATTLFTNALIERKGIATALLTTAGFRDTLEIGRERKYDLYDLDIVNPAPLVPRDLRIEVSERMSPTGQVIAPLDETELLKKVETLVSQGISSIAISFLHAYINNQHEVEAARLIADRWPDINITISSEVAPEIREYERTSTTVASAYVKPLAVSYLSSMEREIKKLGVTAPFMLMLSSGGLTGQEEVVRNPVQMLESGPAAGALSAAYFGGLDDIADILAFDMGGTTAKLCLVENGEPSIAYGFEAAREKRFAEGSGLPIRISTVELIEIGAGGGSIAKTNEIGFMKVGPESAGSEPGPACYGKGGTEPTVTDANLLLGYLNPDFFAGGTMTVDKSKAEAAISGLASSVSLSTTQAAAGIHNLVNETMAAAARVHIAEKGHDPRRFTLVVTGGGGPVHGYGVARKLGLSRLLCPPSPGVGSALGLLVAPARVDRASTINFLIESAPVEELEKAYRELEDDALEVIVHNGLGSRETVSIKRFTDGRFLGQGFDFTVELPAGPYTQASRALLEKTFKETYRERFMRPPPQVALQFINIRVSVTVPPADTRICVNEGDETTDRARKGTRDVWFDEIANFVSTPILDRSLLRIGDSIKGPVLIEDPSSTLVIGPSGTCRLTDGGNIVVELGE
ncbi:hydantoinase/oxoprolinase family protein [Brucella intermedia]|uniref:hydantoinase/oxoprolinase family protein n=1 Tax=Brucella intermedia TaxID=94625 RepID=UPI00224B3A94|nr:hydantoinase/oxoprolinase family protein [Brucella intermedia]